MKVDNQEVEVTGTLIKTAKIKEEWFEHIEDLASLIDKLKNSVVKADIFTFLQELLETKPKYNYYFVWEGISALYITSYDNWWKSKIRSNIRNKINKAKKKGVVIKLVGFNDELVRGIMKIYNEVPIRRGKPFWHYGKDFDTVKAEWGKDLDKSDFIGAYYNGQLIAFVKLVYGKTFAQQVQNIGKIEHRNKYPIDALIDMAVKICDKKKIPYLTYGYWRRGSHADFLRRHGFERIDVPRYYIPLTLKGKLFLKLKLHRGIKHLLPEKLINFLLDLRAKWYKRKYLQT
jgi:hypothetical protein